MRRFSFTLLAGLLLILWGINSVSNLPRRAVVAGLDKPTVEDIATPGQLVLFGFVGARVASELISRESPVVMLDDTKQSLDGQSEDDTSDSLGSAKSGSL